MPATSSDWPATSSTSTGKGHRLFYEGRTVRVDAFPISIDSSALAELAAQPAVLERAKELRAELGNPRRIILGVDRLDYTKGINVRLQAFSELLAAKDPSVEDTVMVQIATPSRERLDSYVRMREEIERQVGAINGDYGRIGAPAVHYLHQSLPREDLSAFYAAADVMTVTPLRDGMNLVAKEYVAARVNGGGVLLLSEFAGAAKELKSALMVNPYDTDGVKDGAADRSDDAGGRGPAADALVAPSRDDQRRRPMGPPVSLGPGGTTGPAHRRRLPAAVRSGQGLGGGRGHPAGC